MQDCRSQDKTGRDTHRKYRRHVLSLPTRRGRRRREGYIPSPEGTNEKVDGRRVSESLRNKCVFKRRMGEVKSEGGWPGGGGPNLDDSYRRDP